MTGLVVVGLLFGGAFTLCSVLWFLAAISGQISDDEERGGIRRS